MKESKKTYTLILVALLTVSAYFLADTVDAMIGRSLDAAPKFTTPLEQRDRAGLEPRREMSDYSSILERGLFGDGKVPSGGAGAAVETTSYKLIGTIEGESFAGAVLEDSTGQVFYRINQKLPDGSMIVKVMRDRIVMKNAGGATVELSVVDDTKIVNLSKSSPGFKKLADGNGGVTYFALGHCHNPDWKLNGWPLCCMQRENGPQHAAAYPGPAHFPVIAVLIFGPARLAVRAEPVSALCLPRSVVTYVSGRKDGTLQRTAARVYRLTVP
jgi:hypothetical protein